MSDHMYQRKEEEMDQFTTKQKFVGVIATTLVGVVQLYLVVYVVAQVVGVL